MLYHYLKTAIRSFKRNKNFTAINIAGLAIGMASALLIILWLQNMITYDRFHEKADRLYALYNKDKDNAGEIYAWNYTSKILAPTIKNDYPEVEAYSRYQSGINFLLTTADKKLKPATGAFADNDFLSMFSFPLLKGNKDKALKGGDKIVLTEKFAKALFGKTDVLGKNIKIDSVNYVSVSGILKDLPSNTFFNFDYILSWDYANKLGWLDSAWDNNSTRSFILLYPNANIDAFNQKIENIVVNHTGSNAYRSSWRVFAHPLNKYYLYNKDVNGKMVKGRIEMVRLFAVIAALILLVACINFMNLSTARSEKKAKEVGIRKVIGAERGSLILQFVTESILLSFIAFVLALALVYISLPYFSKLTGQQLYIPFSNFWAWLFALAFILFTGILAGSYPAFMLSSFQPVKVLKSSFINNHTKFNMRSILVVVQFTFAILLIIATVVISRQIIYTQKRDVGYNQNQLLYSEINGNLEENYLILRNELLQSGAVTSVSKNMSPVTQRYSDSWGFSWAGSTDADKRIDFVRYSTDANLVKTMGMQLLQGRDIDVYKYPTDSTAVLLTETAWRKMHVKNPIDLVIKEEEDTKWHVVGVVKDILIESPNYKIEPMLIFGAKSWFSCIHYRLNADRSVEANLAVIKKIFEKYNSDYPFEYNFTDAEYAKKFDENKKIGKLATLFAALTIFISCLGLFGLVTFMAERRTKEIGIRKVLGASVLDITTLLSKDFLKLVLLSFVLATPVAWYAMHRWLSNFDYRVSISVLWFLLVALGAIVIALLTVGIQAVNAAKANPVKSLKVE